MDDCVKRTHENKEAIKEMGESISKFGGILREIQKTNAGLGYSFIAQSTIAKKLRKDLDASVVHHNVLAGQVTQLHESTDKLAAESTAYGTDLQKMGVDNVAKWTKHEIDHKAVNARLNALEELRRLDNINRAQENTAELNNVFMAGFQRCLEVQIMNGTFPRRLPGNKAFMDFVRDKDGLLAKVAEKDSQTPWKGGPSHQQD